MASAKEIQNRMRSIEDTMKITNAMYLISSTKLKKARKAMDETRPYFSYMQSTVRRIMRHLPDIEHKYIDRGTEEERKNRKRAYVVVTGDKGLAGAYNHNILNIAAKELKEHSDSMLFVIGEYGRQYFNAKGYKIDEQFHYAIQRPTLHRARMIVESLMKRYEDGDFGEVQIIYTEMDKGNKEVPTMFQLMPLQVEEQKPVHIPGVYEEEFIMWPSPESLLDTTIPNCGVGYIYGALIEAYCSEQNARMTAMQAANDSAAAMIRDLSLQYNHIRQAAITQEITEVIGGAKALKRKKRR